MRQPDPTTMLAFNMGNQKGVYALLLGSGVSSGAGIRTGWQITLDLVRRYALGLSTEDGEEASADPVAWCKGVLGCDPNYDDIMGRLTKTREDRQAILQPYFEDGNGDHRPCSEAHKAIAQLVKRGYIKVFLTTNFDRLVENAIAAECGRPPQVIASPDQARGALPLAHEWCTVIKLHGDYKDARILNTSSELKRYHRDMTRLLKQVLDEYGLVVCGWSATWDTALRDAILGAPNRRFAAYWAQYGAMSDLAREVCDSRKAEVIDIASADAFFTDLEQKVTALEKPEATWLLSVPVAVATTKRLLHDPAADIKLDEFVRRETEWVYGVLWGNDPKPEADMDAELTRHEVAAKVLTAVASCGGAYGGEQDAPMWVGAVRRMLRGRGLDVESAGCDLQRYAAVLLVYAFGIGAVAQERWERVATFLRQPAGYGLLADRPLAVVCAPHYVASRQHWAQPSSWHPVSDRLHAALRDSLRDLLPNDDEYERCFCEYELVHALQAGALDRQRDQARGFFVGRFWSRWPGRWFAGGVERDWATRFRSTDPRPTMAHWGGDLARSWITELAEFCGEVCRG